MFRSASYHALRTLATRRLSSSPARTTAQVIFSGIQPTGVPHLGNYLGALKNWVDLQNGAHKDDMLIYSVVGLHAFTIPPASGDPNVLRNAKLDAAASLIAVGIDPQRSILFHQDEVPEHAELAWVLNCLTPVRRLQRMTTWKAKIADAKNAASVEEVDDAELCLGLLAYPVLQAADVLLYKGTHVPVGEDQFQHIELMRGIATTFNSAYSKEKPFFPLPVHMSPPNAKRIRSLRDPTRKMSKSAPSADSRILLTDRPETVVAKLRRAVTDSDRVIAYDPDIRPGVANLIDMVSACSGQSVEEVVRSLEGKGHAELKGMAADTIIAVLDGPRREFEKLRADEGELRRVMTFGAERARVLAKQTLHDVKTLIGLA
ncbi:tryptophanyl-tRNA synthetase [Auriculariales sp. MPI-PUGE-AT-0066]|nr:tryptophanyl-tRNA synthetase [Auriculariales sp. MPI-PUGE-AT-0066]